MKEAVRRLQDGILYPSDQLGKGILRKVVVIGTGQIKSVSVRAIVIRT